MKVTGGVHGRYCKKVLKTSKCAAERIAELEGIVIVQCIYRTRSIFSGKEGSRCSVQNAPFRQAHRLNGYRTE